MNRREILAAGCAAMAGAAASPQALAQDPNRRELPLGTSPPGGGFTPFGDALAATINELAPSLQVVPVFTKGSTENIPMLESGRLALGLVGGEPTFEALSGIGRQPAALKIVAPMYSSAGMFVVSSHSTARTISDLKGQPVIFGAKGSGLVVQARYVLRGIGLDMDRDFQPILLDRDDAAIGMLDDGSAKALWGGGVAWPAFAQLSSRPSGARFIVPNEAEKDAITRKFGFLSRLSVAAGTYPNQPEPIHSVGSWSVVLVRSDMADETAYDIARAVHLGERDMARRVGSGRETRSVNTWTSAAQVDFIHPGVLRYLKDAGISPPAGSTSTS